MEKDIKTYFGNLVERYKSDIKDKEAEMRALCDKNEKAATEEELKAVGNDIDALKKIIAGLREDLAEAEAQLAALDNPAEGNPMPDGGERSRAFKNMKMKEERTMENIYETKEYRNAWLKRLMGNTLTETEQRSIDSGDVAVIPTETLNTIITKAKAVAPLLDEITLLHVAGNVKIGVEGTVNDAAIHSENGAITAAEDTIVSVSLGAYEIVKLVRISATVKTMAISAFEAWLTEQLARKIAESCEKYIVKGTGSSQPKGIDAETYVDNTNGIAFASSSAVTYDEIVEVISLLPQRHNVGAKFYMNRKMLWAQVAKVKDDGKYPIFNQINNTIMGYPVVLSDFFDDGDMFFGNLKNGYYGNLSQDIKVESSAQSGFAYNAIDYRGTAMFDGKMADTTAIIKGSNSL